MSIIDALVADATKAAPAEAQPTAVAETVPETHTEVEGDTSETQETETQETKPSLTPEQELDKVRKALARKDRTIGKLTAQKYQAIEELQQLRNKAGTPAQEREIVQDNKGVPTKLNPSSFQNYADFIEARAAEIAEYHINKQFAERDGKQEQHVNEQRIGAWEEARSQAVDTMADAFAKDHPDINGLFDEYADVIREYPKELKHALLAADNPPLAFYNLAKDGKLDELANMSLIDARVEIRLAQLKDAIKPKTKAAAPLPTSRGSAPGNKPYSELTPREAQKLLSRKKD